MNAVSAGALSRYVKSGRDRIPGWLARVDAEIFQTLAEFQTGDSLAGAMAEIGVHHGKFFVALSLALAGDERAYCIDIFDAQHFNKDSSGSGSRHSFESNLVPFGVRPEQVIIDARPSQDVAPQDILGSVGPVRFFSVDGGHWLELVQSDLTLAEATLADHGIVALDDFHRAEWPDVSAGYFAWQFSGDRKLVPFAIGYNKLYLCNEKWAEPYQQALRASPFLRKFLVKKAELVGRNVDVYQSYPIPEWPWRIRIIVFIRTYMPGFYGRVFGRRTNRCA